MYTATYSPDDNKLRLSGPRFNQDELARVKAAGYRWAPMQKLWFAPSWSPRAEDIALEFAGEIDDDDAALVERAEARAERFEGYSESRAKDYERAHKAVSAIADNIPFGQPILVGHHSEKRARRDAEKIRSGMTRAVKAFETSQYWAGRAAGAIAAAKYKERPEVRARRIKKLESDLRRVERNVQEVTNRLKIWSVVDSLDKARAAANLNDGYTEITTATGKRTAYSALCDGPDGLPYAPWQMVRDARMASCAHYLREDGAAARWIAHYNNRLTYERGMLADSGYIAPPKRVSARKALPLLNYPGDVVVKSLYSRPDETITLWPITKAEYAKARTEDKGTRIAADGTHRVRCIAARYVPGLTGVPTYAHVGCYLTDSKLTRPDDASAKERAAAGRAKMEEAAAGREAAHAHNKALRDPTTPRNDTTAGGIAELRASLAAGIQVVVAPQLFPTPPDVCARMVELAGVRAGNVVLEPSAGTGNICAAIRNAVDTEIVAVEINPALCATLRQKFETFAVKVLQQDFLDVNPDDMYPGFREHPIVGRGRFFHILMNPPFENGADIKHIEHALKFLHPAGVLVAICANGPRQQTAFKDRAVTWQELPRDTFAGTNVSAAMFAIHGSQA